MANPFYTSSGTPASGSAGLSALVRAEFALISLAFDLLPALSGTPGAAVVINPGGTALVTTTGGLALAGNFATTGAFNTTLAQSASIVLTLPGVSGTLATLAGVETLSNKTLVAPALGTPASGNLANCTGTAAALNIGGNAATATTATTATNLAGVNVAITASGLLTINGQTTFNSNQINLGTSLLNADDGAGNTVILVPSGISLFGTANHANLANNFLAIYDNGGHVTTITPASVNSPAFSVAATQVVGARIAGWGTSTNGTRGAVNGAAATLAQTTAALAQLLVDLKTHGLIGT